MKGVLQDGRRLRSIAATLLALAVLAERAAVRSFPVRFIVLSILCRAEAVARTWLAGAAEGGWPCPGLTCPDVPGADWACLDQPPVLHYGATDALVLALRLRMLGAVLGLVADAVDPSDARSSGWSVRPAPYPGAATRLPLLVLVRRPAARCRRLHRPPDTS